MGWKQEQKFEADWWGNCTNTYWEETKQLTYAKRMGLKASMVNGKYPVYDLNLKSILDIGGGPVSILLKCINGTGIVMDPCDYPFWVEQRYQEAKIGYLKSKGEDLQIGTVPYDEVWIYNVLQHVDSPRTIIKKAKANSRIIRIFEWIDMPPSPGHPHTLTSEKLNSWLSGKGQTEQLNENGCHGRAYYGIFKGDHYEE